MWPIPKWILVLLAVVLIINAIMGLGTYMRSCHGSDLP
jgi:hypothetical protein